MAEQPAPEAAPPVEGNTIATAHAATSSELGASILADVGFATDQFKKGGLTEAQAQAVL